MSLSFKNVNSITINTSDGPKKVVKISRQSDGVVLWSGHHLEPDPSFDPIELVGYNVLTNVTIPAGIYELIMIGAGGKNCGSSSYRCATGGSGAAFKGIIRFTEEVTTDIYVYSAETETGTVSIGTRLSDLVCCNGSSGYWDKLFGASVGKGGVCSVTDSGPVVIVSSEIRSNGFSGSSGEKPILQTLTAFGDNPTYGQYGRGCGHSDDDPIYGTDGYLRLCKLRSS